MDSVSQLLLGASVAALAAPPHLRRRALIYGAALGTLPDLDVLIDHGDPVCNLVLHRGFSHSLPLLAIAAPLLWALASRLDGHLRDGSERWLLAFALALLTHPLLDVFTIYGTQLLWPFDRTPYGIGSLFIIDPMFTLPLLLACVCCMIRPQSGNTRVGLILAASFSGLYLLWSVLAQQYVLQQTRKALDVTDSQTILALPSAFNTVLWRVLVREPDGYREAYFSLWAEREPGPWRHFESRDEIAGDLHSHAPLRAVQAFSHGWWALRRDGDEWVIRDLRMGSEPHYVFAFAIAEHSALGAQPIEPRSRGSSPDIGRAWSWLWQRMRTPGADMPPSDQVLQRP